VKILIAEDDASSRLLLLRVLTAWGHEVVATSNGAEAWEALQSDRTLRLAILDWLMPQMDGVEICARVKAQNSMSPPYLILLTALDDKESLAAGLDAGADDFLSKPYDPLELRARLKAGERMLGLNDRLLEAQRIAAAQARTDELTGILNRRALFEALEDEMARASREGSSLGVGMLDVDHFKRVNDDSGHAGGDAVLCEIVERARSVLRPYDTIGRVGGEEFVIVAPGVDEAGLLEVLERVRRAAAEKPVVFSGTAFSMTVSLGGAVWRGEDGDALIARADDALYRAKEGGRDAVVMSSGPRG
jgi:two-component system, cell cycle response regulator